MQSTSSKQQSSLGAIQVFERAVRAQTNADDLIFHMVNDFPKFLKAEQGFAFQIKMSGAKVIVAAGSVPDVDRNSETLRALEDTLQGETLGGPSAVRLGNADHMAAMPFGLALPFGGQTAGRVPDGVLLARAQPWSTPVSEQAVYLSEVYNHAFERFAARRTLRFKRVRRGLLWGAALAVLAALVFIPIPITVVAPARVLSDVSIPAAPSLDGVVAEVFVTQSEIVRQGAPLYVLRDGTAQAALGEARARVRVARAQETKLRAEALRIPTARQELTVAEAETELAQISLARAQDVIDRHTVRAPIDGMVVADSVSSLAGSPLSFGDAPMQIIDPETLVVQADVALADSVVVYDLRAAHVFFTDAPTQAIPVSAQALPFEPQSDARGGVSYQMRFAVGTDGPALTLGREGVVQLSGPRQSLGYVLFRRPIQWLYARLPW